MKQPFENGPRQEPQLDGATPLATDEDLAVGEEWLTGFGEIDPQDIRATAEHLLNNPWRTPDSADVPLDKALVTYRRAVGLRNLPFAVAIRKMLLTDNSRPDAQQLYAFAETLNHADKRPLNPERLAAEHKDLLDRLREQEGGRLRITYSSTGNQYMAPLDGLAKSLRQGILDTYWLCDNMGLNFMCVGRRGRNAPPPELRTGYTRAAGLRVGFRAAQVLAGAAEIAEPVTMPRRVSEPGERRAFARDILQTLGIGWKSHETWLALGKCQDLATPVTHAAFSEVQAMQYINEDLPAARMAKNACQSCLVRPQCVEWAITQRSGGTKIAGVWGKLTPHGVNMAVNTANRVIDWASPGTTLEKAYGPDRTILYAGK